MDAICKAQNDEMSSVHKIHKITNIFNFIKNPQNIHRTLLYF